MFKKMLFLSIMLVSVMAAHAQTFKISDVDADNKRLWNEHTQALLGKSFTLTFFDRTVRLESPIEKAMILKKLSETEFSGLGDQSNNHEEFRWKLALDKTLGVITNATITLTIAETVSPYRSATLTIKGKRF